jgi:outer membrane protein TolC
MKRLRLMAALLAPLLVGLATLGAGGQGPEAPVLATRLSAMVGRPAGLLAEEVAARAVDTSFTLKQRREEVRAAIAAANQALVGYLPRLTLSARYARLSDLSAPSLGTVAAPPPNLSPGLIPAGTPLFAVPIEFPVVLNQTTLQATLAVPLLDYVLRLPALQRAALATRDAARQTERATRLQIATDARVAYYGWARARLSVVVAEQAVAQARGHRDASRKLFDAGSTSKADTMRVEAQLASSELFFERARNLETVLEEQLRVAMHDRSNAHYEIGEDLREDLPALWAEPLPGLIEEAWAHRIEPKTLKESIRAQQAQASAARGAALPRLDAFGDVLDADPNPRFFPYHDAFDFTWDVGLSLSWTPNDSATNALGARGADARAHALEAQLEALHDALHTEVVQAYEAVREADFAVQTTSRGLDAAEESYRVRKELFLHGRSTSFELTDAETDLTQARLASIGARIDQRITRARLKHALGRDVAEGDKK